MGGRLARLVVALLVTAGCGFAAAAPKVPTAVLPGPLASSAGVALTADPSRSSAPKGATLTSGSLQWGDGTTTTWKGAPAPIAHTYQQAGAFTLTLKVTASTGKSDTAQTTATIAAAVPTPIPAPSADALLQPWNLVHEGSFGVPDGFDYQGSALTFNPLRPSLFLSNGNSLAELTIPALGARASYLQPLADPVEGRDVGAADERIGGTLVETISST